MTQPLPQAPVPAQAPPFAAMLRGAVVPTVCTAPVIVLGFWATRHTSGGLAALLGVCVALAFLATGLLVVSRMAKTNPMSVLVVAVAVYLGQIIVLGVVILSLSSANRVDGTAFALSVLVVALVWQLSLVRSFVQLRKPVYDKPTKDPLNQPAHPPEQRPIL
jgi:ATP synthase protein I